MNAEQMIGLINAKKIDALETEWLGAIENKLPLEEMTKVLAAVTKAELLDTAETMAGMLLEERKPGAAPAEVLDVAKAAVAGVPISDELRAEAAAAYKAVFGGYEHFEAILNAAGLLSGQSPRRALRTMDTCLAIEPDRYLVNRFDHEVVRALGYNDAFGEFEVADAAGRTRRMEPKELADEFDLTDDDDFRVLHQHRPEELGNLIAKDLAGVLIGVCKSVGGEISGPDLREMLVPAHLTASKWSSWWGRARTAAKRCEQLSVGADRPIRISYHPHGLTLEEELAADVAKAKMPLDRLAILQHYDRELRTRKGEINPAFAQPLMDALADQAVQYADRRPADALAAALAVDAGKAMGMPAPTTESPSAAAVLAVASNPAVAIADLSDASLWAPALTALAQRDDVAEQVVRLLRLAPADLLDTVAACASQEALAELGAEALASPRARLETCLWLWKGPAKPIPDAPAKVEIFRRFMTVLQEVSQDLDADRDAKRDTRQRIRSALSAADYASFRQTVAEIDEAVAGTILNVIRRIDGLSDAVLTDMLGILREKHYRLFMTEKVKPWEDESVIWTSEAALQKREAELKHLVDVKMLENANAIGAAAAHGDLSENSEWQFAIEERDLLRAQAAKMQDELARVKVIQPNAAGADEVVIGSRVSLTRTSDGQSFSLTLLGPWDSNLDSHVYNYQTPLALALLGKAPGEEVVLKLSGEEATYRIDATESAITE